MTRAITPARPASAVFRNTRLLVLFGCTTLHLLLADIIGSPWGVPDLTLVGLLLVVAQAPERWLAPAIIAGMCAMTWAMRFPGPIFLGYVGFGWLAQRLARHWDLMDVVVQRAAVLTASLSLGLGMLWLQDLWSVPLVGCVVLRAVLTDVSLRLIRSVTGS